MVVDSLPRDNAVPKLDSTGAECCGQLTTGGCLFDRRYGLGRVLHNLDDLQSTIRRRLILQVAWRRDGEYRLGGFHQYFIASCVIAGRFGEGLKRPQRICPMLFDYALMPGCLVQTATPDGRREKQ